MNKSELGSRTIRTLGPSLFLLCAPPNDTCPSLHSCPEQGNRTEWCSYRHFVLSAAKMANASMGRYPLALRG
eukprot:7892499-Alexandrium_andersonii.AAC.1